MLLMLREIFNKFSGQKPSEQVAKARHTEDETFNSNLTLSECSDKLIRKYVPEEYLYDVECTRAEKLVTDSNFDYYIVINKDDFGNKLYRIHIYKWDLVNTRHTNRTTSLSDSETCKFIIEHFEDIKKYLLSRVDKIREDAIAKENEKIRTQNCISKLNRLIESDRP